MPNRTKSTAVPRFLPLAAVSLVLFAAPVAAQQAGEPTALQRALGAIGLLEIPEDPIVYRERPPLVVPPSTGLVEPRNPDDISRLDPDWPVDHDRDSRNAPDPEEVRRADEQFYSGRPLLPGELGGGRISRQEAARREAASQGGMSAGEERTLGREVYSPRELGFRGWGAKQEAEPTVFTGVPARARLTDPPSELFRPSDKAPYGVVTKGAQKAAPPTLFDRVSGQDDPAARR